ncbi:hypothetical protein SYNPS1DRAFT_30490 [Syncephalis pseudoplumigaleata]|uniref:Uncharacterized protein n=1 Tax=Syncephalis pseudoplumigaleata TaxID=1712513 RepID=A0A4P9YV58_9FUNG|nr:hypothetical protein SYNPS1DRAFT_30490 [Syncephalis pseudoplumigaleata]|eukprot:RKP23754.1 hypothetical protein SYNPS1DRAFT_30490 [Syncephalis pseudoplumigaleata]
MSSHTTSKNHGASSSHMNGATATGTASSHRKGSKKDHDGSHPADHRGKPPIAATTVLGAEMANDRLAWRSIQSWRDLVTGCDPEESCPATEPDRPKLEALARKRAEEEARARSNLQEKQRIRYRERERERLRTERSTSRERDRKDMHGGDTDSAPSTPKKLGNRKRRLVIKDDNDPSENSDAGREERTPKKLKTRTPGTPSKLNRAKNGENNGDGDDEREGSELAATASNAENEANNNDEKGKNTTKKRKKQADAENDEGKADDKVAAATPNNEEAAAASTEPAKKHYAWTWCIVILTVEVHARLHPEEEPEGPLIIKALANRDWRTERKRRLLGSAVDGEHAASEAQPVQGVVERTVQDTSFGLQRTVRKRTATMKEEEQEEEAMVDTSTTTTVEETKVALSLEEQAVQALYTGK